MQILQQFKTKTILVTFNVGQINRTTMCFSANLVFPVELKKNCKQYANDNDHCLKNRSTEAG